MTPSEWLSLLVNVVTIIGVGGLGFLAVAKWIGGRLTKVTDAYAEERAKLLAQAHNLEKLIEQTRELTKGNQTAISSFVSPFRTPRSDQRASIRSRPAEDRQLPKYRYTTVLTGMMTIPALNCLALFVMLVSSAMGQQTSDELFQKAKTGDQGAVAQLIALATTGNVVAQYNLGYLYFTGKGISKDSVQAANWYRKAAEQGDAAAQHNLGYLYSTGEGVPKDSVQAITWYRKAAEQGYAAAQYNLGYLYSTGQGVPQDSVQAVDWYRKAAEQGQSEAQNNLGAMYEFGAGVPKDLILSYLWYDFAAAQGDEDAKKRRDGLGNKMTPTQIAEAKAMGKAIKIGRSPSTPTVSIKKIPMLKDGGVYKVPVLINSAITLDFIVDSGASDVMW